MVATTSDFDRSAVPSVHDRRKLLRTWVQDRIAASTFTFALLKRSIRNNKGTLFAPALKSILDELYEERDVLDQLAASCGAPRPVAKQAAGWLAEKVERLKLDGHLVGYSPLSRVLEIEMISAGTYSREMGWVCLAELADEDRPELDFDWEARIRVARRHRKDLEQLLIEATKIAF